MIFLKSEGCAFLLKGDWISVVTEDNSINWWKTLPKSPDLNPIELVWHELKHFLRNAVKPQTKEELIDGITRFWAEKVNVKKCTTYTGHMHKVLPLVVASKGRAFGK